MMKMDWVVGFKATTSATQEVIEPSPTPLPLEQKAKAAIMHANWLTNAEFDMIAQGNVNGNDHIQYRCTAYPQGYDQAKVDHLKNNYKAKIPGLQLGLDCAYYNKIIANAAKIKNLGFDFVDYNLEAAFDGPNADAKAKNNLEKIRKASNAVHAQGMRFKLSPGRPNTNSFKLTGLLDDVAKLVDHYHIQIQTAQDTTNEEYGDFTEDTAKRLRAAKPSIIVTSQVSPAQGAQPGKTLQQTMRDVIAEAMSRPPPGNTNGVRMWIGGEDVQEAKSFFAWFKQTYP
jgi:hypothetical protein